MSCNTVVQDLMPCVPYVLNGGQVPLMCCVKIRSLYATAKTTRDKQTVCVCRKNAFQSIPYTGTFARLAAGLPTQCKANLPYKISPSTDGKSCEVTMLKRWSLNLNLTTGSANLSLCVAVENIIPSAVESHPQAPPLTSLPQAPFLSSLSSNLIPLQHRIHPIPPQDPVVLPATPAPTDYELHR